jgi:acetyl esterase/lipase
MVKDTSINFCKEKCDAMLKRFVFICTFLMFGALWAFAQTAQTYDIDLWPNGLPNTNGVDHKIEDVKAHNYKASIRVFLPDSVKATGRAIVACPGGGYSHLALDHEGYEWASFYNELGIAYIVLKYRLPFGNHEVPISDAYEAIRQVRYHANEWHINPNQIGIMGSSAGGHLASTVATHATSDVRPNFQILFYPVISMDTLVTHRGSHDCFLGKHPSAELERLYSNDLQVKSGITPPAIIFLSNDDNGVKPENSIRYYLALHAAGIPASFHIYPTGGHGWGFKPDFFSHKEVLADLANWLRWLK